jgi:hypothetical protein
MRAYVIIIAILCVVLFGAVGAQNGFGATTTVPFLLSLSALAYFGLSGRSDEPITFDRLTSF